MRLVGRHRGSITVVPTIAASRASAVTPIGLGAVMLVGCTSPATIAEEMRDGLKRANEAVAVSLIALEPASYAIDPEATLDDGFRAAPLRHPAGGPCPSNEHETEDPDVFVAELDYGAGCLPRSGLIPTVMSDKTLYTWDVGAVTLDWIGVRLALANVVVGAGEGLVVEDGEGERLELDARLTITGDDRAVSASTWLNAHLSADEVVMDGTIELPDAYRVRLEGLELPLSEIRGECPTPVAGTATVEGGRQDVVVSFGADGQVTAQRGRRESDPAYLCNHDSWLFDG